MCGRLCGLLLVPLPWPIFKVLDQFQNCAHLANYKYPAQLIESGTAGLQWTPLGGMGNEFTDTLRGLHFSASATLGRMFLPTNLRKLDLDLFPPSDRFCHSLLDYMWVHPQDGGNSYPSIYASREEVDAFVRVCGLELEEMSEDERRLLEPLRAGGAIPPEVLWPLKHGREEMEEERNASRTRGVAPYVAEPMSYGELAELLQDSAQLWAEGYDGPTVEKYWQHFDLRKIKRLGPGWDAISKAVTGGEVASFDARPLFPAKLFNMTVPKLAELEGEHAERISMWNVWVKPASLRYFGRVVEEVNRHGGQAAAYANTKRLGKFFAQLPDVAAALGLEKDVLRAESFLWLGNNGKGPHAASGGLHFDEEANVYVQVAGEQFMLVIPTNFTSASFGAARHWDLPPIEELERDPYFKQVPVHLVHMKPGDGITFPGRTYHYIMSPTPNRISLNFFYIPRWRRMEYTPSDWYSQEAERSLVRLALRQLWARSFARLFDETGKAIVYMGSKLEYN